MRLWDQLNRVKGYFSEFREFRVRGESIYAIERLAQLVIQSLLDLGAMIAVYRAVRKPDSYRGIAEFMAKELELDRAGEEFLRDLAGFRNILVHGYASIDRALEEVAFKEIEIRLGSIISRLEDYLRKLNIDPKPHELGIMLKGVFEKYNVEFVILFGSRARGDYRHGSDYDLAVKGVFKSALELGGLIVNIADALGIDEELVDIVLLDSAPPSLIYTIINEGTLIYGDSEKAFSYLVKKYLELLDLWSLRTMP